MTYNVHQLLHLQECVRDLGPLWTQDCFFFEDLNGDLREMFHGTQSIDNQIIQLVSVMQKLPEMAEIVVKCDEVEQLYQHLIVKRWQTRGQKLKSLNLVFLLLVQWKECGLQALS